jgi:hypothetical protein
VVFVGDQNKQVINLLELNIEYKIVIYHGMKCKFSDLIVSSLLAFIDPAIILSMFML